MDAQFPPARRIRLGEKNLTCPLSLKLEQFRLSTPAKHILCLNCKLIPSVWPKILYNRYMAVLQ